jgi:hypothetical protein
VAEKASGTPRTRQRKRSSKAFKRNVFIDFMNLSRSPYIDLTIDIGHLFPKIVLFRYNRFWAWTQKYDLLFEYVAHENRAIEEDDERGVACGSLGRRKDLNKSFFGEFHAKTT